MGFTDAIKSGFQRYFDFATRSSRSEYWFWALFVFIAGTASVITTTAPPTAHIRIRSWSTKICRPLVHDK